jgi:hypothetical protein
LQVGTSNFTAWVWMGIVMMNMMRRTSMTSMSGVVFRSMIGAGSRTEITRAMSGLRMLVI